MTFTFWISHLIAHLHVTPNGIVIKPGKIDRLIYDGSIKLKWNSHPIRETTDTKMNSKYTTEQPLYDI